MVQFVSHYFQEEYCHDICLNVSVINFSNIHMQVMLSSGICHVIKLLSRIDVTVLMRTIGGCRLVVSMLAFQVSDPGSILAWG